MARERVRGARQVWDGSTGRFMPAELYLKGPVPWSWIIAASSLPGSALRVGLCLWRLAGATKKTTFPFGNAELEPFGIDRPAKSRALDALEEAGLITVTRM